MDQNKPDIHALAYLKTIIKIKNRSKYQYYNLITRVITNWQFMITNVKKYPSMHHFLITFFSKLLSHDKIFDRVFIVVKI